MSKILRNAFRHEITNSLIASLSKAQSSHPYRLLQNDLKSRTLTNVSNLLKKHSALLACPTKQLRRCKISSSSSKFDFIICPRCVNDLTNSTGLLPIKNTLSSITLYKARWRPEVITKYLDFEALNTIS